MAENRGGGSSRRGDGAGRRGSSGAGEGSGGSRQGGYRSRDDSTSRRPESRDGRRQDRRADDRRSGERPDRRDSRERGEERTGRGRPGDGSGGDRTRGGPAQGRRGGQSPARGDRRPVAGERTAEQTRYDGPDLPEEITGKELDRNVAAQLRGLPEKLAARVARHLVAAGQLIDTDPEAAYQHALAARARASRVAVVREAVGEAAYAAGHFSEALAELRAAKRMNGAVDYLPVMADCERALGRPERALELASSPAVSRLPTDQQIEMTIVEAGARADLGEVDGALRTLEHAPLRSIAREDWVVRLRYAYADLLLQAGRRADAMEWFHRTAGIDGNQVTDAAERVAELAEGEEDRPSE